GTRWHEDDFLGRLISADHGNPDLWQRVILPALAERGDPLGRAPGEPLLSPILDETPADALQRWEETRRAVGSYAWQAQYQQAPAPAKGAIFDADWWEYYEPDDLPARFDRVLTTWDMAFKATDSS